MRERNEVIENCQLKGYDIVLQCMIEAKEKLTKRILELS